MLCLWGPQLLHAQAYAVSPILPANLDTISTLRPTFVWNAMGLNERCSFSLKLCSVNHAQSPYDALQLNSPVILAGPLVSTSLNFPVMNSDLDSATHYVWQVLMYDSGMPVFVSEPAEFYTPYPKHPSRVYWLVDELVQKQVYQNAQFTFRYHNRYNLNGLHVALRKANENTMVFEQEISLQPGMNYFDFSQYPNFPFLDAGSYWVTLTAGMNEHYEFVYVKN